MATSAGYLTRKIMRRNTDLFLQANILLDDFSQVRISNFGSTRSQVLRCNFAAPELFRSTSRTQDSDIYAFGCLYYEAWIYNCAGPCAELNVVTRFIMALCLLQIPTSVKSETSSVEETVRPD